MTTGTSTASRGRIGETREGLRLASTAAGARWRQWGPYLSERQWGTVREDYSANGSAWEYFPHDHARSRAYRWGEDGLGGFADDKLRICLSVALWNGNDPILKERLFGLTNAEGNHGEDVKELYYYLDGVPTHAYMKMLYKYPQAAFPYADLVAVNAARGLKDREYELIDTGVFDDNRYFDVEIEYAKAAPDDILLLITAHNRGAGRFAAPCAPADLGQEYLVVGTRSDKAAPRGEGHPNTILVSHPELPPIEMLCEGAPELLFCDNETNTNRLYGTQVNGCFKDGINDAVVNGNTSAVNSERHGTKAAAHYILDIPAGGSQSVRVRLRPVGGPAPAIDFDAEFVGETRRGGRVLRRCAIRDRRRRSAAGAASGARRNAVVQAVLRLRRAPMASRRSFAAPAPAGASQRAKRELGSSRHGRHRRCFPRRHPIDARRVGVSMVRGLGPRVPLRDIRSDRSRIRKGPVGPARPRRARSIPMDKCPPMSGISAM